MHQVQLGSTGDLNNYPQLIAKDLRLPKIQSGILQISSNLKLLRGVAKLCMPWCWRTHVQEETERKALTSHLLGALQSTQKLFPFALRMACRTTASLWLFLRACEK